ncbi:MAG: GNAT family N-acetyltransferase [Pseudomonadota bacterium]
MIEIRSAVQEELPALVALFGAMLDHYGQLYGSTSDAIDTFLRDHLFGPSPSVFCRMAWQEADALGFATYTLVIPGAGLGRELFLKELYTAETARGRGAGKALMIDLAKIAKHENCQRMRWITGRSADYVAARALYAAVGGHVLEDAVVYAMDRGGIDSLVGSQDDGR